MDGREVGSCPAVKTTAGVSTHSVRVGEALGNNLYLVYENEEVKVLKDSTQSITATLTRSTAEKSPALFFALSAKPISRIPMVDDTKVAAFSPDAKTIAIGAETNSVRLYNAADGSALRRLGEKGEYWVSFVTALSFSADGEMLASNGWLYDKYIGEINIWDVKSGRLRRTIPRVKKVSALAFSPNGKLLAAGVEPNIIKLWNVQNGKLLWSINAPGGSEMQVSKLFFSKDGRWLVSSQSGGNSIDVYDVMLAQRIRALPGMLARLNADGRLVTYSFKNSLATRNVWRSVTDDQIYSKQVKYYPTESGIGEQVIVNGVELWNVRSEQLMLKVPGNYFVAFSADGSRLLVNAGGEGYVVWSLPALPNAAP